MQLSPLHAKQLLRVYQTMLHSITNGKEYRIGQWSKPRKQGVETFGIWQLVAFRVHISLSIASLVSIAGWRVLTASRDLIAHRTIHGTGHLADAEFWANHGDAKVFERIVIQLHDALQLHTPPHEDTAGANVQSQPSAAAPAPQGFPEGTRPSDCIGVGNADHRAAQALEANPFVAEAIADASHAARSLIPFG